MTELDPQPKSIQSLYSWYSASQLWVNRRYQRKLVWTLHEKQHLIESVLRKYPIPAILLAERGEGQYEVLDGLQRLHTLMSFIETQFPTATGHYFAVTHFPTANNRATEGIFRTTLDTRLLSAREVGTILDYSLAVTVMRSAQPSEIDDVFSRINTYGHRLSDQERRQAGVQNSFSSLIREIACNLRGDISRNELELSQMPSISIDLPLTKHGYQIDATNVFWVQQGILRSTDLRDSLDEQCIADIVACLVGEKLIARSKDALDAIYQTGSTESIRIERNLESYGSDRVRIEFDFLVEEVRKIISAGPGKLRDLLFNTRTTNPFPALFAVLFIAMHELLIKQQRKIADYEGARQSLNNLNRRVSIGRSSATEAERRQNINQIKGLLTPSTVPADHKNLYDDVSTYDIDQTLRRSEIESPHYELKQGILRLDGTFKIDETVLRKLLQTACAIANNGKGRTGAIIIGVADRKSAAEAVTLHYDCKPIQVGKKFVVGVRREASQLNETTEMYVSRVRSAFENSGLSEPLKSSILASLTFSEYYGLGVLVIPIPEQAAVSSLAGKVYVRVGDSTKEAMGLDILNVAQRFER